VRARLTPILAASAVVLALWPSTAAAAASTEDAVPSGTWFSAATAEVQERAASIVELTRTLRAEAIAAATPPPPPPAADPGTYIWPTVGPITSPFGPRWGRQHTGVDIDGATGGPIVAAQSGTVTHAGWKNGYGNTVIIDHGEGVSTLYAHQTHVAVHVGQVVPQGHYLGGVGATGNVTAAHLHYEVFVNGVHQNPMPWLAGPSTPPPPPPPPAPAEPPPAAAPDEPARAQLL
jgi:murein DD-endopeptidase MepM/ murein hydrolase activator NlpD